MSRLVGACEILGAYPWEWEELKSVCRLLMLGVGFIC